MRCTTCRRFRPTCTFQPRLQRGFAADETWLPPSRTARCSDVFARRFHGRPSRATSSSVSAASRKRSFSRRSTWCHAQFKNSFIFKYSARPGTKAAGCTRTTPESVKRQRNNSFWPCRTPSAWKTANLGRTVEILVEGPSKVAKRRARPHPDPLPAGEGDSVQLVGRTVCDRIVVFDGPPGLTGRILPVVIEKVDAFTLFGRQV